MEVCLSVNNSNTLNSINSNKMDHPAQPTFANGKICFLEIPAVDIQASCAFYQAVFGWHIRQANSGQVSFDDTTGQVSGMLVLER